MEVEAVIRTRRTHKAFAPEPVPPELLEELLELARWAPNHHLTNPWRFRVIEAGRGDGGSSRPRARRRRRNSIARRPSSRATALSEQDDQVRDEEDLCATACAAYTVLLAAHGRGLAGYFANSRGPANAKAERRSRSPTTSGSSR